MFTLLFTDPILTRFDFAVAILFGAHLGRGEWLQAILIWLTWTVTVIMTDDLRKPRK